MKRNENRTPLQIATMKQLSANLVKGIPDDLSEEVAKAWNGNCSALHQAIGEVLRKGPQQKLDSRFQLLEEFILEIPADFQYSTCLASFVERNRGAFFCYDTDLTDSNFSRVSSQLIPGKYRVKIFEITTECVNSSDCLKFLKSQKVVLAGAQGLSFVWEKAKDKLPVGKWLVSFDEKKALWVDPDGFHRLPYASYCSYGFWHFYLGYFENNWGSNHCLLCLCDLD